MAGVFRKAMVWLGLAPDEEYDDYGWDDRAGRPGPGPARGPGGPSGPAGQVGYGPAGPGGPAPDVGAGRTSRAAPRGPAEPDEGVAVHGQGGGRSSGAVRPLPSRTMPPEDPRAERGDRTPTVRPMRPTSAKPSVVTPESFDDAKHVADRFKAEQPVVMDLAVGERDLTRRLIDFASGLCYALGGHMERVSPGVYLLTPPGVEVSDEERRRLRSTR